MSAAHNNIPSDIQIKLDEHNTKNKNKPIDPVDLAISLMLTPDELALKYSNDTWYKLLVVRYKKHLLEASGTPNKIKEILAMELHNLHEGGAVTPIVNIEAGVLTREEAD